LGEAADFFVGHEFAVLDGGWAAEVMEFVGGFGALDAFEAEDCDGDCWSVVLE
jgi:hypothetical protein